jgi:hypothetical protein
MRTNSPIKSEVTAEVDAIARCLAEPTADALDHLANDIEVGLPAYSVGPEFGGLVISELRARARRARFHLV